MNEIVNIGCDNKDILASVPKSYRKIKIEKLGDEALKQVLDMVKKGYSYEKIAKVLSEIYETNIKGIDVSNVLKDNAKLMVAHRSNLEKHSLMRANMVLDESIKFADAVDNLDQAAKMILDRLNKAITNDDVVALSKALSDNARSVTGIVRNFKRLTGQSQEKPSILIDQSTKQLNVSTDGVSTNRLVKELGMANFDQKKYKEPETTDGRSLRHKKKETIVDVEIVENKEYGEDD